MDEYDALSPEVRREITGVLNAGHTKDMAYRWKMERNADGQFTRVRQATWAPIALASKERKLPPATMERSIVLRLKHDPSMTGELYRAGNPNTATLKAALAQWAKDNAEGLRAAFQTAAQCPDGLSPRDRNNWQHLFQLAAFLGGGWLARAQLTALALSQSPMGADLNLQLLRCIKRFWDETDEDAVWSEDLCAYLNAQEGAPWAGWHDGEGIRQYELARKLGNFEQPNGEPITSKDIKRKTHALGSAKVKKGYRREWFDGVFAAYAGKLR